MKKVADLLRSAAEMLDREKPAETKLAEARLQDGTMIATDAEVFEEGANVYTVSEEGESVPVGDGEYILEDGKVLVVTSGLVSEVREAEAEVEEDLASTVKSQGETISRLEETIKGLTANLSKVETLEKDNTAMAETLLKLTSKVTKSVLDEPTPQVELNKNVKLENLKPDEIRRIKMQEIKNQYSKK